MKELEVAYMLIETTEVDKVEGVIQVQTNDLVNKVVINEITLGGDSRAEDDDQNRFGIARRDGRSASTESDAGEFKGNTLSPENVIPVFSPVLGGSAAASFSNSKSKTSGKKPIQDRGERLEEEVSEGGQRGKGNSSPIQSQHEKEKSRLSENGIGTLDKEKSEKVEEDPADLKKDSRMGKRKTHINQCLCKPCKRWRKRSEIEKLGGRQKSSVKVKSKSTRRVEKSKEKEKNKRIVATELSELVKGKESVAEEDDEIEDDSDIEKSAKEQSDFKDSEEKEDGGNTKWNNFINGLRC